MKKKRKIAIAVLIVLALVIPYRLPDDAHSMNHIKALLYSYEESAEFAQDTMIMTKTKQFRILGIPVYTAAESNYVFDD